MAAQFSFKPMAQFRVDKCIYIPKIIIAHFENAEIIHRESAHQKKYIVSISPNNDR